MDNNRKTDIFQALSHWGPASLVSVVIHALALYLIVMQPPLKVPAKRVVQIDPVITTQVTLKPAGGQAGGLGGPPPAPKAETLPQPPPPKPAVAPKPKPKPVVKPKPVPAPEEDPIPPRLAVPRPVPPVTPPKPNPAVTAPSPAKSPPDSGSRYSSSAGTGSGRGSGSGFGTGSGTGRGTGSGTGRGTGTGTGTGTGSGSGAALQGYLSKVRSLLERHKIYPSQARSRNEQGTVVLRFNISSDGSIGGVSLSRSSGHSLLDQAAQDTVQRVRRFPPFPGDLQRSSLTVQVPLAFRLQGG